MVCANCADTLISCNDTAMLPMLPGEITGCAIVSGTIATQNGMKAVHTQHIELQLELISKVVLTIFEIQSTSSMVG